MEKFKGTKGKWILDSGDMLTIRAVNENGRVFIAKSDIIGHYERGYKFSIAKAKAKKDNVEVERLRKELVEFDEQQFANARLMSKAPEMLEMLQMFESDLRRGYEINKNRLNSIQKLINEAT